MVRNMRPMGWWIVLALAIGLFCPFGGDREKAT